MQTGITIAVRLGIEKTALIRVRAAVLHALAEVGGRIIGTTVLPGGRIPVTLLAPDIVEAILAGRQPEGMMLPNVLDGVPFRRSGQRVGVRAEPHLLA